MTQRLLALVGGFVLVLVGMLGIAFVWFETHMASPMVSPTSSPSTSELAVVVNFPADASIADALDTLMYYGVVDEPIFC